MTVRIYFTQPNGETQAIDAELGESVMRAALDADVPGITAECGGAATCGTCHAYLAGEWAGNIDPPSELELEMLELVIDPRPASRLTCQIPVSAAIDGATFELPPPF